MMIRPALPHILWQRSVWNVHALDGIPHLAIDGSCANDVRSYRNGDWFWPSIHTSKKVSTWFGNAGVPCSYVRQHIERRLGFSGNGRAAKMMTGVNSHLFVIFGLLGVGF